jgi:hypothetical protein
MIAMSKRPNFTENEIMTIIDDIKIFVEQHRIVEEKIAAMCLEDTFEMIRLLHPNDMLLEPILKRMEELVKEIIDKFSKAN